MNNNNKEQRLKKMAKICQEATTLLQNMHITRCCLTALWLAGGLGGLVRGMSSFSNSGALSWAPMANSYISRHVIGTLSWLEVGSNEEMGKGGREGLYTKRRYRRCGKGGGVMGRVWTYCRGIHGISWRAFLFMMSLKCQLQFINKFLIK